MVDSQKLNSIIVHPTEMENENAYVYCPVRPLTLELYSNKAALTICLRALLIFPSHVGL